MPEEKTAGPSKTQWLVDAARDVIIEGVKFGLDEAGTRLLGPTAWRGFKQVISPVIKRIQQRFPALSFGKPEDKEASAAARDAAQYLGRDKELQRLLSKNFASLAEGQEEILSSVKRLERIAETGLEDHQELLHISKEILAEVKEQKTAVASAELPTWVDISDELEHYDLMFRTKARRRGIQIREGPIKLALFLLGTGVFQSRVLEEGKTHKAYKCRILNEVITISPTSDKYNDENGQLCRRFTIDTPSLSGAGTRVERFVISCKVRGFWQAGINLKREEYKADQDT